MSTPPEADAGNTPPASAVGEPTAPPESRPYATLTPDAVLDALAAVGLRGDGRLLQLNSYENRVFQAHLEDGRVVVAKFYRAGRWSDAQILEEHAFALELARAEVPVVAPMALHAEPAAGTPITPITPITTITTLAAALGEPPTLARVLLPGSAVPLRLGVWPRAGGRAPELEDPQVLAWIGRFIARLHACGERQRFTHRATLGVDATGRSARDWLAASGLIPPAQHAAWLAAADTVLGLAQAAFDRAGPLRLLRLHGDCHVGNLLWTEQGPHFVDLDDACNGPAVQDLWMLLAGDRATMQMQLHALLQGYEALRPFDRRELGLIEALRALRLLHHSAWLARRWADPAFPAAFPWFGTPAYWSNETTQLREQIGVLQAQLAADAAGFGLGTGAFQAAAGDDEEDPFDESGWR